MEKSRDRKIIGTIKGSRAHLFETNRVGIATVENQRLFLAETKVDRGWRITTTTVRQVSSVFFADARFSSAQRVLKF